ncbi:conserved nucleotide binding protein [Scheffersomyces stipitis CBS 6054]|uniref:Conserved nucleotide binding protein n=1 Tax=Scheffersomyces stipitis (strain ATCC 58785 / CBS 6054 / NBRC 10063 / NRRL Y-11545) TaxID=322104 RepID=A3LMT1_PICST|nr:conserved nucleotide binding protein [Scheffersomyces stipitis CBS 6054]ABN64741.2 conserved nucleotide binding protein [Scheffersomyces stipitis CBS 6054]
MFQSSLAGLRVVISRRSMHASLFKRHENPLGLPKFKKDGGPEIPRMSKGLPMKQKIPNVKRIVLVSSGKGGVGKSTVSVNVALALRSMGKQVGLLDADIFGPSIPKLMNLSGEPRLSEQGKLLPLSNYGIETMSMGYLIPAESALAWRGLMVMKALQQLLFEVQWSNLDYLVVDMPPGTGDTQLTISQQLKVDGAVIVSTPQDIALIDAIKGITMFNKVNIPILGLVQNMSYFVCSNCNHESHIFGTDGAKREAEKQKLELLGSIPLSEDICSQSDLGKPVVISHPESSIVQPYLDIARKIITRLA